MNITIQSLGKVLDGRLILTDPAYFKTQLKQLDNQEVIVTVKRKRKTRSNPQNDYYHGVVVPAFSSIFNVAGIDYNKDQVHDVLKTKYLLVHDPHVRVRSTTELSTVEFNDYLLQLQQWAAELGVYIPDPNEVVKKA
jgi:hypothetical protein